MCKLKLKCQYYLIVFHDFSYDTMTLFVVDMYFTLFFCVGGFDSYLFGMSPTIAKQIPEFDTANDVKSLFRMDDCISICC